VVLICAVLHLAIRGMGHDAVAPLDDVIDIAKAALASNDEQSGDQK